MKRNTRKAAIYERMIRNVLLNEATLTIGAGSEAERYFLPDDDARAVAKEKAALKKEDIITGMSDKYRTVMKNLESLNPSISHKAMEIYFANRKEMEEDFEPIASPPAAGESGSITEKWQKMMLMISEGDRAGAVGKGEILACFLWKDATMAGKNEPFIDVRIGGQGYSVKYAERANSPHKLNGVYDVFKRGVISSLKSAPSLVDCINGKMTNQTIIDAIAADKSDDVSRVQLLKEFLNAADATVRSLGKDSGNAYIFFHQNGYSIVGLNQIIWDSADSSQAKVGIRSGNASDSKAVLRQIADGRMSWPKQIAESATIYKFIKETLNRK